MTDFSQHILAHFLFWSRALFSMLKSSERKYKHFGAPNSFSKELNCVLCLYFYMLSQNVFLIEIMMRPI